MRFIRNLAVLTLAVNLVACGAGGGTDVVPADSAPPLPFSSLGELADAIEAAALSAVPEERLDSDGDSIPDVVERRLGTNPALADSDHDGLVDPFELFGPDYTRSAPLPDANRNGLTAAADNDDDGDNVNDGLSVDTDGDGVPNYFEFYGYTFDVLTGQFRLWDGNEATPHFFTDPLQPSTDQDAYPDGMEASGALLDPTVRHPGDDPLVPATPNIVFQLVGYEVTLNEDIAVTQSQTLSKGRTWTHDTETTYSLVHKFEWEVGGSFTGTYKSDSAGVEVEINGHVGGGWEETNSTATTNSTEESVLDERGWSEARSSNPTDAAHIKLFLKVSNRGTAPISNLVPTLTLRIGGRNVATFEPGGSSVAMLVPGQVYPEQSGINWVVSTLGSGAPLSLTMSELRALERGAPVSISLTQARGDVMQLAGGGRWESIGDTNQYVARCDAVCARVRIDLEDGTTVQQLVYADDRPSSPVMTLGAALAHLGVDDEGNFVHYDQNGTRHVRSLNDFACFVDPETLRANGWALTVDGAPANTPPDDRGLSAVRLLPTSQILLRAPRDAEINPGPRVHYAYLDALTGEVQASVADYGDIASVSVVDGTGALVLALEEELAGAGFFSGFLKTDGGSDDSQELFVVATNDEGVSVTVDLGRLFQEPDPVAPVITTLTYDEVKGYLYANVESGKPGQPNSNVLWVKAFHPDLPGGVAVLGPVVNAFEDENGYSAHVDFDFHVNSEALRVVAYVAPDVYTQRELEYTDVSVGVYRSSTSTLEANYDQDTALLGKTTVTIEHTLFNFDAVKIADVRKVVASTTGPTGNPTDIRLAFTSAVFLANMDAQFHFNMKYVRMTGGFSALKLADVVTANPTLTAALVVGQSGGLAVGDVFGFLTADGRYGKFKVQSIASDSSFFGKWRTVDVVIQHVTWNK